MREKLFSSFMALLLGAVFFKAIFKDFGGFLEACKYWLQPDIISAFKGEWNEDQWQSMKLLVFIFLTGGAYLAALAFFRAHFPAG